MSSAADDTLGSGARSGPPPRGPAAGPEGRLAGGAEPDAGERARRIRLGSSSATAPELLARLAGDPDVTVRAAVALNPATPSQVDRLLIGDADERVRLLLARRLAELLPSSESKAPGQLGDQAMETLGALVDDEAVRVRAAIADVLKDMLGVPHELILRLARDSELSVSEPVLRLSPVLTESDLLSLTAQPPHAEALSSIAGRPHLPSPVCDAIAASTDSEAIRTMLANQTAAIQESTLDGLVDRARTHAEWHAPLVYRPSLPPRMAQTLSRFVATQLLELLAGRTDLGASITEEVKRRLEARLASPDATPAPLSAADEPALPGPAAESAAQSQEALLDAIRQGERERAMSLLATRAGISLAAIRRICATSNSKALVSVVWKAGFPMRVAGPVQSLLAHLQPGAALLPGPANSFPLSTEEMTWQLSFLAGP